MCPDGFPIAESQNWQAAFLPGIYQGTYVDSRHSDIEKLIAHIRNHGVGPRSQRAQLDLLTELNREHLERGVRFVQFWHGRGSRGTITTTWKPAYRELGRQCDQAIGAFLKDLKQRGMLDDTWVVWGFVARDGMTSRASDPFPLLAKGGQGG